MNRKTNVPTEQQKKVQKTQKKRTELDNTLKAEQSNKRLKTAN